MALRLQKLLLFLLTQREGVDRKERIVKKKNNKNNWNTQNNSATSTTT